MPESPYTDADFARKYVEAEIDVRRNRYEWEVTHPALDSFIDTGVRRFLDYGCGSAIFSAAKLCLWRGAESENELEAVAADSSQAMVAYAQRIAHKTQGLTTMQWDAVQEDSSIQDGTFDRVFAKLVFNYISPDNLRTKVLPRLRSCLRDSGILVAVVPNPLREVDYRQTRYQSEQEIDIQVGSFGEGVSTTAYRHTWEELTASAEQTGFHSTHIFGLPDVRFVPYRPFPWTKKSLMPIADPFPLIFSTLNAAKRWIYVFGAGKESERDIRLSLARLSNWRTMTFPEVADAAHVHTQQGSKDVDVMLPVNVPRRDVLYDYTIPGNPDHIVGSGAHAQMSPRQKMGLVRDLIRAQLRPAESGRIWVVDP